MGLGSLAGALGSLHRPTTLANVEEGRRILADSGLNLQTAVDLADAARKVAAIVN